MRHLQREFPEIDDPESWITRGKVLVDGFPVTNPRSQLRPGSRVSLDAGVQLRGAAKLSAALTHFGVVVQNRIALDAGAAAGGFVSVLLEQGARRIYAVDAGYGQLRGDLRSNPRVITLERTNIGELDTALIPDGLEVVTLDLSYLSLQQALPQLNRLNLLPGATLVALVKPMFELGLAHAPQDQESLRLALERAAGAAVAAGWQLQGTMESPRRGAGGAIEGFLCGRRG